ncbi:unnamed protein product [Allacma fusca]|uniref:Uncharacterized protein n=1 Tax=Allacma fusca TaxID=39272 RepID=A0A8J2M685_9HEXA|nr:unnamed protein product [Allacma fusca]
MDPSKRTLKPPIKISILEKPSEDVSYCWKACQLFSYVIVVISGIATSMAIGNIQRMFHDECVLYSNLTVTKVVNGSEIHLLPADQHWGSRDKCNYCQFLPVASVICAGIWGTLFVMCGRGGNSSRNLPQPWRIVPPAIVFNFVFVVLSCVSVVLTFEGFSVFCSSLESSLNISR